MFQIDHVILGCSDLQRGTDNFDERTGLRPIFSGIHPTLGTHNALASLGSGRYLEIIAPRPHAHVQGRWRFVVNREDLTLAGWAVRAHGIHHAIESLHRAGFEMTSPASGSRIQPGGALLQWTTADFANPQIPLAPFLIEWSETSEHPSTATPEGCTLESLEFYDPDPAPLTRLVEAMGLAVTVRQGEISRMILVLGSPNGRVTFEGERMLPATV